MLYHRHESMQGSTPSFPIVFQDHPCGVRIALSMVVVVVVVLVVAVKGGQAVRRVFVTVLGAYVHRIALLERNFRHISGQEEEVESG